MSYSGSTAASTVANPVKQIFGQITSVPETTGLSTNAQQQHQQGGNLWYYSSTNKTTDITASNFFSDGKNLGMRPGDGIFGNWFTSAGSSVVTFQGTVVSVNTSGASLSTGSLITSTFA